MNIEKEIEAILPMCLERVEAGEILKLNNLNYVELPLEVKKVRARELAIELLSNKEFISLFKNEKNEETLKRIKEIFNETFNNLRPIKPLKP